MKKKLIKLSIVFLFIFSFILSLDAFAYAGPPLIYDEPELLTTTEKAELSSIAEEISDRYSCAVSTVFVNDLNSYIHIRDFADDFYDSNGYGFGSTHDGIMLVVSMTERKTHLTTSGKAIDIFTDYGLDKIEKSFLSQLSARDYGNAVKNFLSSCEGLLKQFTDTGIPADINNSTGEDISQEKGFPLVGIIGSLCGGFALGSVPLRKQKKEMESVHAKANASDYKTGSLKLSLSNDKFITKNITRVQRPRNDNRGSGSFSGGSSIHISSSGTSHGGRSGSF